MKHLDLDDPSLNPGHLPLILGRTLLSRVNQNYHSGKIAGLSVIPIVCWKVVEQAKIAVHKSLSVSKISMLLHSRLGDRQSMTLFSKDRWLSKLSCLILLYSIPTIRFWPWFQKTRMMHGHALLWYQKVNLNSYDFSHFYWGKRDFENHQCKQYWVS